MKSGAEGEYIRSLSMCDVANDYRDGGNRTASVINSSLPTQQRVTILSAETELLYKIEDEGKNLWEHYTCLEMLVLRIGHFAVAHNSDRQAGYRTLWYKTTPTTTKRPIHDLGVIPPFYLRDVRVKILISLMHHGNDFWSVDRLLGLRSKHRHAQAGGKNNNSGIAHNVDWRCREVFSSLLAPSAYILWDCSLPKSSVILCHLRGSFKIEGDLLKSMVTKP